MGSRAVEQRYELPELLCVALEGGAVFATNFRLFIWRLVVFAFDQSLF